MNPAVHINAFLDKVGTATEAKFSDRFFSALDCAVNALDNVEARLYMDQRCVTNQRPLLESGTLGPKGHTQIIVPFLTESYASRRDPPEKVRYSFGKSRSALHLLTVLVLVSPRDRTCLFVHSSCSRPRSTIASNGHETWSLRACSPPRRWNSIASLVSKMSKRYDGTVQPCALSLLLFVDRYSHSSHSSCSELLPTTKSWRVPSASLHDSSVSVRLHGLIAWPLFASSSSNTTTTLPCNCCSSFRLTTK